MPKYIKKRKRGERKEHKVINNIKHKQCSGICKKWKSLDQFGKDARARDGTRSDCKSCVNKRSKQRRKVMKEKRKKEREMVPSGFLVCLKASCIKGLQPMDQFISAFEDIEGPTSHCKTCRDKVREAQIRREAPCQKVWDGWRIIHPCVMCMNDPEHEHNPLLIEADHLPELIPTLGKKVKACSDMNYWCHSPVSYTHLTLPTIYSV